MRRTKVEGLDVICCLMHIKLALAISCKDPQSRLAAPSRMGGRLSGRIWGLLTGLEEVAEMARPAEAGTWWTEND